MNVRQMADGRNYLRIIMANYIRFKEKTPDRMKWDKTFRVKNVGVPMKSAKMPQR